MIVGVDKIAGQHVQAVHNSWAFDLRCINIWLCFTQLCSCTSIAVAVYIFSPTKAQYTSELRQRVCNHAQANRLFRHADMFRLQMPSKSCLTSFGRIENATRSTEIDCRFVIFLMKKCDKLQRSITHPVASVAFAMILESKKGASRRPRGRLSISIVILLAFSI